MDRFKNKTAVVTGSTSGIGKAIAQRLASEGAVVIINSYRDHDNIQEILDEITMHGGQATFIRADMGQVEDIENLFLKAVEVHGKVDVLINNAGIQIHSPFLKVTEKDFDRVIAINLKGYYFAIQHFVRHAVAQRIPGVVVNNSSVHEIIPFPNFDSYAMSKGGLRMMTRNLAVELAPLGIRVNNIAPGAVATDINESLEQNPELKKKLLDNISMGRMGKVEEIAAVAAFLASDDASYVTGATYLVDGGLTYHYTEQ